MIKTFELPEYARYFEELAFSVIFEELKVRGSDEVKCQVKVIENGEISVIDTYDFNSWEEMKKSYPSLLDFLKELMNNDLWESSWRNGERIYYIESLEGSEGLYDEEKTVWCDGKEENSSVNENDLV